MAKGIDDLGNGQGYIYKVKPNKTDIVQAITNTPDNAGDIKVEGLKASSVGLNRGATGSIKVATVPGIGTISSITINLVNQITTPIPYTGATTPTQLAVLIAAEINSTVASTNYTATSVEDIVYLSAPVEIGSADNGQSPMITKTGVPATTVVSDVDGGTDAGSIIDDVYGWTFFLDANYGVTACSGSGIATPDSIANAIEITNYVVNRGFQGATASTLEKIVSGKVSFDRESISTILSVETEGGGATDDLDFINSATFAEGDMVTLKGVSAARVTTVKHGTSNIQLSGGNDFDTGDLTAVLELQLKAGVWYEMSRSTDSIGSMADYRAAGYGIFNVEEYATASIGTGGTTTYTAGTDKKWQVLTGSSVLLASQHYQLNVPGAVNGDDFYMTYDASVAVGGFVVSVFGITLTTEQALKGGLIFHSKFIDGAWRTNVYPNMSNALTYKFSIYTGIIEAGAVTVPKVSTVLKTELITFSVSFDTNRIGDYKIVMPYACTVNEINGFATDTIEASDDADFTFKNNAGLTMGTETLAAAAIIGTGFTTVNPSANHTFAIGDVLTVTTTKATPGGNALLSIEIIKS